MARGKTFELFPEIRYQPSPDKEPPSRKGKPNAGKETPSLPAPLSMERRRPKPLWIAIHLPQLPLAAAGLNPAAEKRPVVLVETNGRRQRVVACNDPAVRMGMLPGMGLEAAYARCAHMEVRQRAPDAETAILERLAGNLARFTPSLSMEPPDGLLLEVRGSLQLFGGIDALRAGIEGVIREEGLAHALALSVSPRAASWLSRSLFTGTGEVSEVRGALAELPLAVTRWPEAVVEKLASMGVRRIGECLRLPRDGFARRLGPRFLREIDQALGSVPDLRRPVMPRLRFRSTVALEEDIAETALLSPYLAGLLQQLESFLMARQRGIQSLQCLLRHRQGEPTRKVLRFAAPVSRQKDIEPLLRECLVQASLRAPIHGVTLKSGLLLDCPPVMRRMSFDVRAEPLPQDADAKTARLFEKLKARLGGEAVYRLCPVDDHRPEKAWVRSTDLLCRESSCLHPPFAMKRPLWLIDPPQVLEEEQGWPCRPERLTIESGPERIESGWWDGQDVMRDYYVARNADHCRLWIYRDCCLPRRWFLQGIFG